MNIDDEEHDYVAHKQAMEDYIGDLSQDNLRISDGFVGDLKYTLVTAGGVDLDSMSVDIGNATNKKYINIATPYVRYCCFFFAGRVVIYLALNNEKYDSSYNVFNQSLDSKICKDFEVAAYNAGVHTLAKLSRELFSDIIGAFSHAIVTNERMTWGDFGFLKYLNTHRYLMDLFMCIDSPKKSDPSSSCHLSAFAWIYYVEVYAISDLCSDYASITIHDVATSTGHFPLLLSALPKYKHEFNKIRSVECSDLVIQDYIGEIKRVEECISCLSNVINASQLDLESPFTLKPKPTVITANDVLEHFFIDDAKNILSKLWAETRHLLLVHVPIEATPSSAYGHLSQYTREELDSLASQLPECENVTYKYLDLIDRCDDASNRNGFLILRKIR